MSSVRRVQSMSQVYQSSARVSESRPWRVALSPWRQPMASHTSSMLVNDDPDVTCPKQSMYSVDVVALAQWSRAQRHHRTALLVRGTACVRTRRAVMCAETCRRFNLQQAAYSLGPFSSQVHGSRWAAAIYYAFRSWSTS